MSHSSRPSLWTASDRPATPSRPSPLFAEPALFYDPPYDRTVDDEFAWHLVKYLVPQAALQYQPRFELDGVADDEGQPRTVQVDFLVEVGARTSVVARPFRVAFALEDETSEEPAAAREADALLLGTGEVDVLYRLRAEDVLERLHDVLLLLARWEEIAGTDLFSERGQINLRTLAQPAARAAHPEAAGFAHRLRYDGEGAAPEEVLVRRLSRAHPAAWHPLYVRLLHEHGVVPKRARRA